MIKQSKTDMIISELQYLKGYLESEIPTLVTKEYLNEKFDNHNSEKHKGDNTSKIIISIGTAAIAALTAAIYVLIR